MGLDMNQSTRAVRYQGRHTLRTITTVTACFDCGRESVSPGGAVGVRLAESDRGPVVGFSGLGTCGRIWLCPVCNSKVMAKRAVEIGAALTWAAVEGLRVVWGSLTCRHNAFTSLVGLLRIQTEAWRHVVQARAWSKRSATATRAHVCVQTCESPCERKRDTYDTGKSGRVGYIRAAEVTQNFGDFGNGWHPHFHPIILWRGSELEAQAHADDVVDLWIEGVEKAGGEAGRGDSQQLRVVSGVEMYDALSGYVTKATYDPAALALETVWSQGKTGKVGRIKATASHWALLASVEQGLADDVDRWTELEHATNEHRMITWSRGLRTFAGLNAEKTDWDVAAAAIGTVEDTVCMITPEGWLSIRDSPELLSTILDVLESDGWEGLRPMLDAYGVDWTTIDGLADVVATDETEQRYADLQASRL